MDRHSRVAVHRNSIMYSRQRDAFGSGLAGSAGRADVFHVVTDVDV